MLQRFFDYLRKNQVIFALFIIVSIWFVIQIRDIIVCLFLSYIIMASVLPIVENLRKRGVHKVLAVLIPYSCIILLLVLLILPLIPFVATQVESFIQGFPKYLDQSAKLFGVHIDPKQLQSYLNGQITTISSSAFEVTTRVFGGIFSLITIFVVSFYLLLYNDQFKKAIAKLFHAHHHERVLQTVGLVNDKLGAWLQGQILLCISIGAISYIALMALGIPYALPLALVAAVLEAVPTLGPILSAIPSVIVALTISPTMALVVVATYILIQMLENQFLVPKIMERAVGLNPVIVIIGVTIGANLMGLAGALLAIPFISFVIVVYKSLEVQRKNEIKRDKD
jgi:predicted PurR-regulated permease PerM